MTDEEKVIEGVARAPILREQPAGACADCGRRYGDEYGFPDLLIPDGVWKAISPKGHEGGLLCPSCICRRLHEAGIQTTGRFVSGALCEHALRPGDKINGMVLVPVEPTEEMLKAGVHTFLQHSYNNPNDALSDWRACYRAMLQAISRAPTDAG